jgi:amidophosphoribosyltransferase
VYFNSDNDGELLLRYIAWQIQSNRQGITEAIRLLMKEIRGAYSSVLLVRDALYMFRDPLSIRPMVWGIIPSGAVVVASESCALATMGVKDYKEVPPAGIIRVNSDGITVLENDPNLFREVGQSGTACLNTSISAVRTVIT